MGIPNENEPKPRHTLHIRVEPSLADWIKRLAAQDRRTVNNWCERALGKACEQFVRELAQRIEPADVAPRLLKNPKRRARK